MFGERKKAGNGPLSTSRSSDGDSFVTYSRVFSFLGLCVVCGGRRRLMTSVSLPTLLFLSLSLLCKQHHHRETDKGISKSFIILRDTIFFSLRLPHPSVASISTNHDLGKKEKEKKEKRKQKKRKEKTGREDM